MALFHYDSSDESDQNASTTATYFSSYSSINFTKGLIASFLKIMCDHTSVFSKKYMYACAIQLLLCIAL